MTCLPRERSRKTIKGSGGFKRKFATNGFFYVQPSSAIISAELFDRFPSLVSFRYDRSCNASADENRTTERNIRVDHDGFRLLRGTLSGKGIKSQRHALFISLYPSKMCF